MNTTENIRVTGEITATFYDQSRLSRLERAFNCAVLAIAAALHKTGQVALARKTRSKYILGSVLAVDTHRNVICNAGFNAITKLLTGTTTYTGIINKALLGVGVGTAAATDTTLIDEVYRNEMASGTDDSNIAYLTALFTEDECSGTYTEFGNVIDGAADADTGQLWSHLAGLNWVKDGTTALVVSQKYTFASV